MIRTAFAAVPAALLTAGLSAAPALAAPRNPLGPQEGADVEASIGVGAALLLYVVLPLALLLLVAALVWLPGVVRGAGRRYRPGRVWDAVPVWFGGPADPVAAVASAPPASAGAVRGGAGGDW